MTISQDTVAYAHWTLVAQSIGTTGWSGQSIMTIGTSSIAFSTITIVGSGYDYTAKQYIVTLPYPNTWRLRINGADYSGFADISQGSSITLRGSWPAGSTIQVYRAGSQGDYNVYFRGTLSS